MLPPNEHRVAFHAVTATGLNHESSALVYGLQAEHAALKAGSHAQAAAEQLQSQLSEQQMAAQNLRQDLAAMQLQLVKEGAARRGLEQQSASLEQQLASERISRQELVQQNVSLQQQLDSERSARAQLQGQLNSRLSELAGAERQLAAAQAAQAELQALLGTERAAQADLQAQLNAAQAAQAELQSQLGPAQAEQRQGDDAAPGDGQAATTVDTAAVHRLEPGNAQDLLAQIVTLQAQVIGGSTVSDRPIKPCCDMRAARWSRHLSACELAMQSAEAFWPGITLRPSDCGSVPLAAP